MTKPEIVIDVCLTVALLAAVTYKFGWPGTVITLYIVLTLIPRLTRVYLAKR